MSASDETVETVILLNCHALMFISGIFVPRLTEQRSQTRAFGDDILIFFQYNYRCYSGYPG